MPRINKGRGLEQTVKEIYTDLCYTPVRTNVNISRISGSKRIYAEIDVIYNYFSHERYVECKYRTSRKVTLEEVSKFAAVLQLFDIPLHNGEVITNHHFDDRAIKYSQSTGIRLIDGDELKKLSNSRWDHWNIFKSLKTLADLYRKKGIKEVIDHTQKRALPLEKQIRKNS